MEYRGAHGAALAIEKFDDLGKDALTASTTSVDSVAGAISELNGKVKKVVEFALSVKKRSLVTTTVEVNTAVQAVYKEIADACRAYNDALRNASPDARLAAARALADSRATVGGRVPALATAVGVTLVNARDAAELAKVMRKQRSAFMGVGAEHSGLLGVWKIGNAHITDLQDGTAKVDLRKVNVVTRDEFEVEFQAWRG
ncbi:hypothetical protein BJF79_26755 [Actinomadura sp. CNU-125]|uniref:hypothetical protein n=1 Tax=Actinomadura sp. CNU-125 TaxID=1904961 RepID=UPI0009611A3A|nr:hypothetical protein [Actinomadura sp. CNU-125]OLT38442.1 hypothetical protein BJF79_26755 [Actinomadura sp. CNU-125]